MAYRQSGPGADKKNRRLGTAIPQKAYGGSSKRSVGGTGNRGASVPDPRYMNPNQAFRRLADRYFRPLAAAAAGPTDLLSLMRFTASSLPGEPEGGIIELLAELHPPRRGDGAGAAGGS